MKVLVASDTHHSLGYLYDAILEEMPDVVIHLGDYITDAEDLSFAFEKIRFYSVPGNCDYAPVSPTELTIFLADTTIFLTHGHLYGVKQGTGRLLEKAIQQHARIALYGHTHQASLKEENGITLLNPGSASGAGRPTYAIMQLEQGSVHCRIVKNEV